MSEIKYEQQCDLSAAEFIDCLVRSTLALRRPIDQPEVIERMLRNADILIAARNSEGLLVGVSRAITDFCYCTYLSDLAVDEAFQGRGIGRALIERTHKLAGLNTMLLLLSAPAVESYYPHIGLLPHKSAWYIPRE
jgi:GNAT superfamily N-acetyltransferase